MPMTLEALTDYPALEGIKGREQRGCAVALVIMGHCAGSTLLHRQAGLCEVKRLDLALFVHAQHDRVIRRVHVNSDNIGHFLLSPETWVAGELECLRQMRFEIVGLPDVMDRGFADTLLLCQGANAPVGHTLGLALQGVLYDLCYLLLVIGGLPTAPRRDLPQAIQSHPSKAIPPDHNCLEVDREILGNGTVSLTSCSAQHDFERRATCCGVPKAATQALSCCSSVS